MTKEEIRQKAIKFVEDMEDECERLLCGKNCPRLKDCTKNIAPIQYNPVKIFAYEHGFADGVEEGKKQASLDNSIECGDCVRQITASDEERIRVDERNKTIDEARGALIKMRETCDAYGYDCDRCKNTYYSYHHSCADYFLEQMKGERT